MTATVNIFAYPGLVVAKVLNTGGGPVTDGLLMLKQRYLAKEQLTPSTGTADTSSADTAPAETTMLDVQVESGKRVYYEVTPSGYDLVTATSESPVISGNTLVQFGVGWRISLLEVA